VSIDLCRVHFPACRRPVYVPCRAHVVGVVPSPRLCRRPFTQHRVEALFFLAEPVYTHSRTREVVRRHMSPSNAAGPSLAVALFMSLVVHMLSALCHRHGCAADLLPNIGSRPCSSWPNLCTRTHAHARSFAGICPQATPPGRSSSFSLSLFPCLVQAINFVSLPWPSRRRSARTHTHATEGPSPCFTYL
jgi:hypothetical protein